MNVLAASLLVLLIPEQRAPSKEFVWGLRKATPSTPPGQAPCPPAPLGGGGEEGKVVRVHVHVARVLAMRLQQRREEQEGARRHEAKLGALSPANSAGLNHKSSV